MAQTSWPFENLDTSETQYSYLMRNLGQGVVSGRGNELEPYGDGSGLNVKVKDGEALVRGHYFSSTGTETLVFTTADPSLPRIDSVVLKLDPTANSILLTVKPGTPNASPAAPSLIQTDTGIYELLIANVAVGAGATAISLGNVTDARTLFSPWTGEVTVDISDVTGLQTALNGKQEIVSGVSSTEIGFLDGVTSAIQAQLNAKQDITAAVSTKTSAYTLAIGDVNDLVQANGTFNVTVPGSVFPVGTRVDVVNIGTGVITFVASGGLTLQSKDSKVAVNKRYAGVTLFFTTSTTALLIGDLA